RLQLMRVLMKNPNVLILDEPTNDLDIDTLNILEEFLERYSGVLLLVSHDRYLMDRLTEQLFILEGSQKVRVYSGNYTDYRLEKDNESKVKEDVKTPAKTVGDNTKKNKLSYKEERELEDIDNAIPEIEKEISELTTRLNEGLTDHEELSRLSLQIQDLKSKLDQMSAKWLEL